eukprot:TRINITY_DN28105_c0_g1_i1.p1 TRINITY_DN28105_c0_g1~~TRINITY_DN28105_c0_g1_i1.p1  ORF type:complete len:1757 (+),score=315.60 TRINITY_DN28105_c0_g1_i1:29-5299(+)
MPVRASSGRGGYSTGLDSPTAVACRGCLSVSSFVPSAGRFLPWRRDAGSNSQERSFAEFCHVMLGPEPESAAHSSEELVLAVSGCGICSEELTPELVRVMAREFCVENSRFGQGSGLMTKLRPFLEDLLVRRQSFRSTVDLLAAAADSDDQLPRILTELTAKDLFLALLFVTPSSRRRVYLATAYSALRVPMPIIFRKPRGFEGRGEATTSDAFDLLHELGCVPHDNRQLILNIGTEKMAAGGKTTLLGTLGLVTASDEDLDVRPSGPMHLPSCDLFCADSGRWVVDMHGFMSSSDDDLRHSVLALNFWGSAVSVVHCAWSDFNPGTGIPRKELVALLGDLSQSIIYQLKADPAAQTRRSCGAVVLVRDTTEETYAPRRAAIEEALKPFGVLAVFPVEDCRAFRTAARRAGAMDKLKVRLDEVLRSLTGKTGGTPSLEELQRIRLLFSNGGIQRSRDELKKPLVAQPMSTVLGQSKLGAELIRILSQAHSTGAAYSTLFPLSVIKRRIHALCRNEGSNVEGKPAGTSRGASRLELLRIEEDMAKARAEEMRVLQSDLMGVPCSDACNFFMKVISSASPLSGIAELNQYLEAWKEPHVLPLLERQRHLLDQSGAVNATPSKRPAASKEDIDNTSASVKAELDTVVAELSELDFSMASFWAELELVVERQGQTGDGHARATLCYQSLLAGGHPFQLLHSRPLQMSGSFLRNVLEAIGVPKQDNIEGIYVVSVLGAQSSAKSTLLNFLFGCGFAVSSGRCTRGLYASYFRPEGGRPMLVLDSEGLLSLGSEGGTFDGQIAMMCLTCSHLVLVNNKGELSRQLQDLLEICLFAMKHLRLARLQPRLAFVLRDQHDRSRTVHEDMLKQMRSHLEDAARSLGSPLQDLILLDGTAVFLLPSAVTSELRQGQEICWTSELFAREVLQLRSEVFRWLREDTERRAGAEPPEFSSLVQWYDYAATVWETLDQFGKQLLHCRTIHEIEQRRELADVAKSAVREALDGSEADGHCSGFHERARQLVDSFVARIHSGPSRFDLDTTDMELGRALAHLRDDFVAQLEELFQEKTADPRFSTTAKEQARQQIRTPIEWAYENHLYTWKLHLKKASDERAMHELWIHFTGVLNRHLESSGHRSCLSEAESHELFAAEWQMYEASFLDRLKGLTKDWQTLLHEVTLLFNHAVGKLQHEAGALALLKEIGPQQVSRRDGGQPRCITEQTDEEWEELYFHVGWWGTMKMHGLALLQNAGGGNLSMDSTSSATSLRSHVIPRMRQAIQNGLQQLKAEVRVRLVFDEATAAEGLRHIANVILHDLETRVVADCSATLKRPQMLHALHVALRTSVVEALEEVETDKQKKAMADLLAQQALVEEHFLLIVQANKGDVERATNFATLYHRSLSSWLDHEVTQLAADVRSQVLQEMPDPQRSSEMAFQMSFASRNWPDVLEYLLDTNAYLEKQFLIIFHQQKRSFMGTAKSRVEKRVLGAYRLLQEVIGQWARRETASGTKVDIVKAPVSTSQRSVKELKDFISRHAERIPPDAETAEAHRQLSERLPATADFQIADPKLFAETLQARIGDCADSPDIPRRLGEQLEKALREQSLQAWSLIRGCSERCPLCGSKCDLVGEHSRHRCAHHLFPAFHGWMDRSTGLPSFHHCLSCDTREGTYECKDGTWRKLEEYLRSDHPSWLPFVTDSGTAKDRDTQILRAAWVNCRVPLLEYFSPMADACPEEWHEAYHEEGRALASKDLQAAKDTIRKLRLKKWVPPD